MKDLYGGSRTSSQAKSQGPPKKPQKTRVPLLPFTSRSRGRPIQPVKELQEEVTKKLPGISASTAEAITRAVLTPSFPPKSFMGYHLQCDINHDFGALPADVEPYNLNKGDAKNRVTASKIDEDSCVDFFMNGPGKSMIEDLDARKSGKQVFTVPDKTASFKNWNPPRLFDAGNDNIGIVQDAGEFITIRLGAQNVLTFGSCLDPAGKPKDKDAKPIWYNPGPGMIQTIPLGPFGFDPNALKTITISSFRGGALVSAMFDQTIDAVRMRPVAGPLKQKPLNNTDIEKAGFFTSIKKAEDIGVTELIPKEALAGTTLAKFLAKYKQYFYIGKTLGDAMLVASAMPMLYDESFQPSINNEFVSTPGGKWTDWLTDTPLETDPKKAGYRKPPSTLILKTGDRLNWLRAILFNVGAIYEDQAKGERSVKQYQYFPGKADPIAVLKALQDDFSKIRADVENRYTKLAYSIRTLDLTNTTFAPGGMSVITKEGKYSIARELLDKIGNALITTQTVPSASSMSEEKTVVTGGLCKIVVDWIDARYTTAQEMTDVTDLRRFYTDTVRKANACSPQVESPIIQKGKQPPYISEKVMVAGVPSGESDWPLQTSFDIMLRGAFSKINGSDSTYAGTDIDRRFFDLLPQPQRKKRGGATEEYIPPDMAVFQETVNETMAQAPQSMTGGAIAGTYSIELINGMEDEYEKDILLMAFPRIRDFLRYMLELENPITDVQQRFLVILDIVGRKESINFMDPDLLDDVAKEFQLLCGVTPLPGLNESASQSAAAVSAVHTAEAAVEVANTQQIDAIQRVLDEPAAAAGAGPVINDVAVAAEAANNTLTDATKVSPPTQYIMINLGNKRNIPLNKINLLTDSSMPLALFNAYSYNVNGLNATALFGESSASVKDYAYYEQTFLNELNFRNLRTRKYLTVSVSSSSSAAAGPAAAGTGTGGGLRRMRPLYS